MQKEYFWKSSILLFVSIATLLLLPITVSAITVTDGTDDVLDGKNDTFISRPNIDVTTVTCELSGNTVTLTMTVKGSIIDSEYIKYTIWTDNDLISGYGAQYWNGMGYVLKDMATVDSEFSISQGNSITFTFTKSDTVEITEVVGSAKEDAEDYSNSWIDYAPDDYLWVDDDEDDDETDESGDEETVDYEISELFYDDTGDVSYYNINSMTSKIQTEEDIEDKPNIDVIELYYEINGRDIICEMKVNGIIENSENIFYGINFNTSNYLYGVNWNNGIYDGSCTDLITDKNKGTNVWDYNVCKNFEESGYYLYVVDNVLIAEMNLSEDILDFNIWGGTSETYWFPYENISEESWSDNIYPEGMSPYSEPTQEDNDEKVIDNTDETPGFEMLTLMVAVAIIFITLRRKKY